MQSSKQYFHGHAFGYADGIVLQEGFFVRFCSSFGTFTDKRFVTEQLRMVVFQINFQSESVIRQGFLFLFHLLSSFNYGDHFSCLGMIKPMGLRGFSAFSFCSNSSVRAVYNSLNCTLQLTSRSSIRFLSSS